MDKTIASQIAGSFRHRPVDVDVTDEEVVSSWREYMPVIFVGIGEATSNLTSPKMPLAMLPVCDVPVLYYNLRYLRLAGFAECILVFPNRYENVINNFLKVKEEAIGLRIVCTVVEDTTTEVDAFISIKDKVSTTNYILIRGNYLFIFPYYLIADTHRKYRPLISLVLSKGIVAEKHPYDNKANPDKLKYVCGYKLQHEVTILENPPLPTLVKKKPVYPPYHPARPINSGFKTGIGDAAAIHYLNCMLTSNNTASGVDVDIPRKIIYDVGHLNFDVFELPPIIIMSSKIMELLTMLKDDIAKIELNSIWEDFVPWIVFQSHVSSTDMNSCVEKFLKDIKETSSKSHEYKKSIVPMTVVGSPAESNSEEQKSEKEEHEKKESKKDDVEEEEKYPFDKRVAPPSKVSQHPLIVRAYIIPDDVHSRIPPPPPPMLTSSNTQSPVSSQNSKTDVVASPQTPNEPQEASKKNNNNENNDNNKKNKKKNAKGAAPVQQQTPGKNNNNNNNNNNGKGQRQPAGGSGRGREGRTPQYYPPLLHLSITNEYTLQIANMNVLAGLLSNLRMIPTDYLIEKSKVHPGSYIAEEVTIEGTHNMIKNSVVCKHTKIEDSTIEGSLIMSYCEIMKNTKIKNCVIAYNTLIEEGVEMEECVIGPGVGKIDASRSPYYQCTFTTELMNDYDF